MNVRPDMRFDKAQFLAWTEHQECKYELADGRAVLQPNVTRGHNRICINIIAALRSLLDPAKFDIAQGDFAVETGDRSIRYADVMVEPFSRAVDERKTTKAIILFEVLSASSMHVDFHEKLEEYKALSALGTYAICAQDGAMVWVWTRVDGRWPDSPTILEGLTAAIDLPAIAATLALAEIYRNVVAD